MSSEIHVFCEKTFVKFMPRVWTSVSVLWIQKVFPAQGLVDLHILGEILHLLGGYVRPFLTLLWPQSLRV